MTSFLSDCFLFGALPPWSTVVLMKKKALLDFLGLLIKCRRELSSGIENEIAQAL